MISIRAGTVEFMYRLIDEVWPTSSTVLTSISLTTDQLYRTIFTTVFWLTSAGVISSSIGTHAVLAGRISFTLVDIVLTMIAFVSLVTFASVTTNTVYAGSSLAWITIALVNIYFAVFPRNTLYAKTFVSENKLSKVQLVLLSSGY